MRAKDYIKSEKFRRDMFIEQVFNEVTATHLWRLRLLLEATKLCLNAAERNFNERISKIS